MATIVRGLAVRMGRLANARCSLDSLPLFVTPLCDRRIVQRTHRIEGISLKLARKVERSLFYPSVKGCKSHVHTYLLLQPLYHTRFNSGFDSFVFTTPQGTFSSSSEKWILHYGMLLCKMWLKCLFLTSRRNYLNDLSEICNIDSL